MPPKADKADKTNPSITEAIHALAKSFNDQLHELRLSHIELKTSLKAEIESTLSDLQLKLDPASSSTQPSPASAFKEWMSNLLPTPFLLLQMDDESSEPSDSKEAAAMVALSAIPPPPDLFITDLLGDEFRLSLHALYGISSQTCMQLTGHIKGHLVSILIDSDSTHNLVQPRIIKHLGLPIEPDPAFLVRVDNSELLRCTSKIYGLPMKLEGLAIDIDLSLLDIHGADLVFGIQSLA
ncbi:hypothetical protein COLO4_03749 [Corchorus olitorius]|uniref:Retroviral aspartyl protease n=1 Tax=Corchorus olitorius TaxID=93759 RepID=A0A1R3KWZ8_9ROSI|nr:hypothetical protein COLO4_03749 [Corchorus olitorius]